MPVGTGRNIGETAEVHSTTVSISIRVSEGLGATSEHPMRIRTSVRAKADFTRPNASFPRNARRWRTSTSLTVWSFVDELHDGGLPLTAGAAVGSDKAPGLLTGVG